MSARTADVVVVGSGFGGAIPAYHLAAGGASVVVLERGPRLRAADFVQDFRVGTYNRHVDIIRGDGVSVVAGNCVGGSSVAYFAASLRAPSFVFERRGGTGRRLWPASLSRASLDPWYDRVEESLPVSRLDWPDISYAGGVWAAACRHAGRTCNPVPVAVDTARCTDCNWMLSGCRFDAKRSLLLNYLPAAESHGARVEPLHEVQTIVPSPLGGYRYAVTYHVLDPGDQCAVVGAGVIHARVVVLAAGAMGTPVVLRRSAAALGGVPDAVGRYFSGNGDRVSVAVMNEERVRAVLGLSRPGGAAYDAAHIGKPITTASFDRLDPALPEFERFTLQQIYFPPVTNTLADAGDASFGVAKRALRARWRSWLTMLAMTEDGNEGVFGAPPPVGDFFRVAQGMGQSSLRYRPSAGTLRGWSLADRELRSVLERDGLATVRPWAEEVGQAVTAHPLSSCRMGDDPATSALTDTNELRGRQGLFVTDAAAVPTSLTVNPSLTVAALAERAVPAVVARAREVGVPVRTGAPLPVT
ncbi:GMC family oxidoreductase [Streptomyces sp. NPDC005805]|uniref:GMC family oxidoreductase n=1 Tax=Streptomyces sp. NPDC005805 TaxID=3157068 RepID=UPI0033C1CA3F